MTKASKTATIALQDDLLGRSPLALFAEERLQSDVESVYCEVESCPALRDTTAVDALSTQACYWRKFACGESSLQEWWPAKRQAQEALRDFADFIADATSREIVQSVESLIRLKHLLALGVLRLKLEPMPGLAGVVADALRLRLNNPGFLEAREIAAACQLRVATVRNAISRREMAQSRGKGVEVDEALDWMVQRRGFVYSSINAMSTDRRINGLLASRKLHADARIEALRQVSRLRLTLWRVKASGRCFGINAEGLHQCLLTLPANDAELLMAYDGVTFEDRSDDPSIRLYRQCFQSTNAPILQAVIPTMAALDAVVGRLTVSAEATAAVE